MDEHNQVQFEEDYIKRNNHSITTLRMFHLLKVLQMLGMRELIMLKLQFQQNMTNI